MAEDVLGKLPPAEVAAFCGRLAEGVVQRKGTLKVSLAAQRVVVFHRNAKRIEDVGLAAPYDFVTEARQITDPRFTAPAEVDPGRRL